VEASVFCSFDLPSSLLLVRFYISNQEGDEQQKCQNRYPGQMSVIKENGTSNQIKDADGDNPPEVSDLSPGSGASCSVHHCMDENQNNQERSMTNQVVSTW